jgi:Gas vesicle synthesis protein GvpL/GvpF
VGLLLYAITTPPKTEPALSLRRIDASGMTAWTADLPRDAPAFTRDDALRYHSLVLQVYAEVAACLPARFPTVFADETYLRSELERRQGELVKRLEAVRGACELAVTCVWTTTDGTAMEVEATTPGRRYLLERRGALAGEERRHVRAKEAAELLLQEAGAAVRDSNLHVCPSKDVAVSLALLVDRQAADELKQKLERQVLPFVRILVHGPWPPYTFAE